MHKITYNYNSDVDITISAKNAYQEVGYLLKFAQDLPNGLTIDGETKKTECELSETLHRIILRKAVELAKQVWVK